MNQFLTATDFPVTWRHHDDAQRFWTQDRLHYPDPLTPLEFSLIEHCVDAGISKAAQAYDIPIRLHDRHINSYLYISVEPLPLTAEAETALAQQSEIKLNAVMGQLRQRWETDWLPEVQQHLAAWQAAQGETASLAELLEQLEASERRFQRVWEIHFLLFLPSMLAISLFADRYQELLASANSLAAYKLLAGFETKTMQSAHQLWALSRQILASPSVAQIFRSHAPAAVMAQLSASHEAQPLLQQLQTYLAEQGQRADKLSLHYPYWVEDPTPVIKLLQDYTQQPRRDLPAEQQAVAQQRQVAVAHWQQQLQTYLPAVQAEMKFLLQAAQEGSFLKEEHGYWIDYKASYCMRQVLLTIARRLQALGILSAEDDLFYLSMAELKTLLASHSQQSQGQAEADAAYRAAILARQQEAARFAYITPPAMLGELPAGPAPSDPISRMFMKIEGDLPSATAEDLPATEKQADLMGSAASPGVVQGTVRIVRVVGDAVKLQPGDILVAESTAPPWTPFFASVRGLVTNSGGVLSHSAVVAREYGIPAVVGTGVATQRLKDGQRIEVDGDLGIVRIL